MGIRLAMGHIDHYDDTVASFTRQLGVKSVQLHTPDNLSAESGSWSLADLRSLRERCERDGLILEGLENTPAAHFSDIQRGGPDRDRQIDGYLTTVRNMGTAGIPVLGYNFIATYVWRTSMNAPGRGGARVTAFDLARVGDGNALAAYKLSPPQPEHFIDADTLWDNHQYFLDAVLPVAEEAGVRLALHPDDPPVEVPLGGAARIFTSPEALARAREQAGGSPSWGADLCLGTLSESGGAAAVAQAIDLLGGAGIAYVHFRDVRGTVPIFSECFLGEGNFDPVDVLMHLDRVGFDGFIIDDHVPAVVGDVDTWDDTSAEAYCSRGRAHAIGYLQGALQALGLAP